MKKFLKFFPVALCAAACILSACNSAGRSTLLAAPATPTALTSQQRTEETFVTFTEGVEAFAAKFSADAYADYSGNANFAVSPVSVYMALSLAAECADGETKEELLSALGVSYETLRENISYLYRTLNVEYTHETMNDSVTTGKLQLGNSIWIQDGVDYKRDCVDALAEYYYCYSYAADFIHDNANANRALRSFVKDQTNGLIDKDFNISDETFFSLINTLYLKDVWNADGDDLAMTTEPYTFTNQDASTVSKTLLQSYYNLGRAYEEESFTSFYAKTSHNFKLKLIVPKDGYTVEDVFTAENIAKVNSIRDYNAYDNENLICYHTRCLFPEFAASYDDDLKDILIKYFGITDLFTDFCNFGRLTDEPVYCSEVRHVTKLEVNKKGIEGAAVTIADVAGSAAPGLYEDRYEDFVADRAFGFVLTDSSDVTLFSGVIGTI